MSECTLATTYLNLSLLRVGGEREDGQRAKASKRTVLDRLPARKCGGL
jgi:hypothetical protein